VRGNCWACVKYERLVKLRGNCVVYHYDGARVITRERFRGMMADSMSGMQSIDRLRKEGFILTTNKTAGSL
jgi:hypothetical protein